MNKNHILLQGLIPSVSFPIWWSPLPWHPVIQQAISSALCLKHINIYILYASTHRWQCSSWYFAACISLNIPTDLSMSVQRGHTLVHGCLIFYWKLNFWICFICSFSIVRHINCLYDFTNIDDDKCQYALTNFTFIFIWHAFLFLISVITSFKNTHCSE